ncbi:MAG: UDP-N-acetylmuramate dehydrogenase [Thermoanaerobaculia bacterium]|nr:UDP-N-acetylmuramate dehydrogenase [Thermoanaerobaculia bacterium]
MPNPRASLEAELRGVSGLAIRPGEPLAERTTFRIGGPAELFVEVESEAALSRLLGIADASGTPRFLLGLGSNLLVPDEGLSGLVIHLGGELERIEIDGTTVRCGAAVPLPKLAQRTVAAGLSGLEALAGFPSTVGGAVVMNAGCYGSEIGDVLTSARVVDPGGVPRTVSVAELAPAYRSTRLQGGAAVVTGATFELVPGDAEAGLERIREINRLRWRSLPRGRNAGSIFRNPPGDSAGRLIDVCGLKGLAHGGARISPRHGNVIVNEDHATALDVLELMVAAREAVRRRFGVELVPEVVLAGSLAGVWRERTAAPASSL